VLAAGKRTAPMVLHALKQVCDVEARPSTLARAHCLVVMAVVSALALGAATPVSAQVDLSVLFAPPTPAEIQAVRIDWAMRTNTVTDFRVEAQYVDPVSGGRFEIVSHVVDGFRHYGAIRYPEHYLPGAKYPVMVACHGGTGGVSVEEASNLLVHFPGQCVAEQFFLVIPSFRGEVLNTSSVGAFQSEGPLSWADRDVDDTRALLSATLDHQADMDRARVAAWGISRGAAVALLLSIRDDRIRRVVDMFGFTDLSLPSMVGWMDAIVNQGVPPVGLGALVLDAVVAPYLAGTLPLAEARLAWLRRSPSYFVSGLPPLQAHHGLQDNSVDVTHTQALLDALASYGVPPSAAQGFYYPTGQHGLNSMPGHGPVVEPFLCALNAGPSGYCGPMAAHAGGYIAGIDYSGDTSLQSDSFRLRVHRSRPNGAGIFFVAASPAYVPSGGGYLCLGLGVQRLGLALVDGTGFTQFSLQRSALPSGVQALLGAGSTAYFQFVFRDFGNAAGPWNFSNGLTATFVP
jgi:predicted esterase